jgi:hypothetical protein
MHIAATGMIARSAPSPSSPAPSARRYAALGLDRSARPSKWGDRAANEYVRRLPVLKVHACQSDRSSTGLLRKKSRVCVIPAHRRPCWTSGSHRAGSASLPARSPRSAHRPRLARPSDRRLTREHDRRAASGHATASPRLAHAYRSRAGAASQIAVSRALGRCCPCGCNYP